MNRQRLLEMATFLETEVPKSKFNIYIWHNGKNKTMRGDEEECGTVACAMGWAAHRGLFNLDLHPIAPIGKPVPRLPSGAEGFHAAVEVFGISFDQALSLFLWDGYSAAERTGPYRSVTTCDVAAKIRRLVAEDEASEAQAKGP